MDTVRRYAMLIDGDWVDTEDRFEIRSPATEEELVASVAKGGREHADRAVLAAKAGVLNVVPRRGPRRRSPAGQPPGRTEDRLHRFDGRRAGDHADGRGQRQTAAAGPVCPR
jgi:hypothetical protein